MPWVDFNFYKDSVLLSDPSKFTELRFFRDGNISNSATVLNYTIELRSTVYCDFDFKAFPFDTQKCEYSFYAFGLEAGKRQMLFYDSLDPSLHTNKTYNSDGFLVTIEFWNNLNTFGFDIKLDRIVFPYLLQYYLPCFFIVMVSFISFIVPMSCIPGRVGLMVTQFLTLTNIFMHQIVHLLALL